MFNRHVRHSMLTAQKVPRGHTFHALIPGFELLAPTEKRRELASKRLVKRETDKAKLLGLRLARCTPDSPCGSAACPECLRTIRMNLIPRVSLKFQELLKDDKRLQLYSVSAVDHRQVAERGDLKADKLVHWKDALMKRLGRDLPHSRIFGAIDVCLTFEPGETGPGRWWPHVYLVIITSETKDELQRVFHAACPKGEGADDPVTVTWCKNNQSLALIASYAFKSRFNRRIKYLDEKGHPQTSKPLLKKEQEDELSVLLEDLGVTERLLLQKLRIIKGKLISLPVHG